MRLLVAVALVVFVGILDDSLAIHSTIRNIRLIVEKMQRNRTSPLLTPANDPAYRSTPSVEDDSGSSEEIDEECAQDGRPNRYSPMKELVMLSFMGPLERAKKKAEEQKSLDPYIRYFCQRRYVIQLFAASYSDANKKCLDADSRFMIDVLANSINDVTEYLCQENGNKYAEFYDSNGMECIVGRKVAAERCLRDPTGRGEKNSSEVNNMDMEDAACTEITAIGNCIRTELMKCPDPRHADFVVGFIDTLRDQLCQVFSKSSASLSLTDSINRIITQTRTV